jgi:hypothetical protein
MVDGGPVTVLALDDPVRGLVDTVVLVAVAILAVFLSLIFYLELFPVFLVALPVPAVHIAAFAYAEILRYVKVARHNGQNDNTDKYEQRTQHMIFHTFPPPF